MQRCTILTPFSLPCERKKCSDSLIMAKQVENLSLNTAEQLSKRSNFAQEDSNATLDEQMDYKRYYVDKNVLVAMDAKSFGPNSIQPNIPYHIDEGRVLMVTNGSLHVIINLEEFHIKQQTLFILVPDSIFEVLGWSDNFDMQTFSFKDLPIFTSLSKHAVLPLSDDQWLLATEYVQLLWHVAHQQPLLPDSVTHLQTSFLLELKRIADTAELLRKKMATRQDVIFRNFIELISTHGLHERKVEFYADKLCITPNYLGDVVKHISGLTVMQWLTRYIIQKAKVILRYSDAPIWEVAEQMNFANPSFFSKFFKRETGLTPNEYRNQ